MTVMIVRAGPIPMTEPRGIVIATVTDRDRAANLTDPREIATADVREDHAGILVDPRETGIATADVREDHAGILVDPREIVTVVAREDLAGISVDHHETGIVTVIVQERAVILTDRRRVGVPVADSAIKSGETNRLILARMIARRRRIVC
jgi:hypothetical protein